jgi:hypothetical protein
MRGGPVSRTAPFENMLPRFEIVLPKAYGVPGFEMVTVVPSNFVKVMLNGSK